MIRDRDQVKVRVVIFQLPQRLDDRGFRRAAFINLDRIRMLDQPFPCRDENWFQTLKFELPDQFGGFRDNQMSAVSQISDDSLADLCQISFIANFTKTAKKVVNRNSTGHSAVSLHAKDAFRMPKTRNDNNVGQNSSLPLNSV